MPEPFAFARLIVAYRVSTTGAACLRQLSAYEITAIGSSGVHVADPRHRP